MAVHRYLVTGGDGFIGSHLVRRLLSRGTVAITVRPGGTLSRLTDVGTDVQIVPVDIRDTARVLALAKALRPTGVFHLAAAVPGSTTPVDVTSINVLGTYNVLAAIRAVGTVEGAVFAGSWYEYGASPSTAPERIPMPNSPYGISKFTASLLVQAAKDEVPGLVVRPFQVYGPLEPIHRLIPQVLKSIRDSVPLRLQNPGASRDWVFVADVAEALEAALHVQVRDRAIDIGTGIATSVRDVSRMVARLAGPLEIDDIRPARPIASEAADTSLSGVADTRPAAQLFDWTAKHDLHSGIRKTVEWHLQERGPLAVA